MPLIASLCSCFANGMLGCLERQKLANNICRELWRVAAVGPALTFDQLAERRQQPTRAFGWLILVLTPAEPSWFGDVSSLLF